MIKDFRAPGSTRQTCAVGCPVFALITPLKDSLVLHPDHSANDLHSKEPLANPRTRGVNRTTTSGPTRQSAASDPAAVCLTPAAGRGQSLSPPPQRIHSPDGGRFGSLHLQVIRLVVHLELGEDQRDGVPRVRQDGPLAVPVAGVTGGDGADPRGGAAAQEVGAGDEAAGATQSASAGVLRCQSTDEGQSVSGG